CLGSACPGASLPEGGYRGRMAVRADVEYRWYEERVPSGLEIAQVYGYLLCPVTGRVLVQEVADGVFNLPGGSPEESDTGMAGTLVREAFEESQVRVGSTAYLGYQEVRCRDRMPFAQVRMAGVIEAFEPRAPDPDGGRLFRRLMTSLRDAPG